MNRRSFLKFLGIGTATAAVAPAILAEKTPEVYPESNSGQLTLKMLQDAYGQTLLNFRKGVYVNVRNPFDAKLIKTGQVVYWKEEPENAHQKVAQSAYLPDGTPIYTLNPFGIAAHNIPPGNYGWIMLSNRHLMNHLVWDGDKDKA